jgi:pimeloyl-ACP methyl ester carboxylesterase
MPELGPRPHHVVQARAQIGVWDLGYADSTVLLLHGFPDHPVGLACLASELSTHGSRVLVPALPGYPPSAPAPGGEYRLANVARDLIDVLDRLEVERAAVVGHDWGASLAYQLGADHPGRIDSIVALAAPHPAGFAERRAAFGDLASGAYAQFLACAADAPRAAAERRWLTAAAQMASPSLHREDWPRILDLLADEKVIAEVCKYYRCDLESAEPPQPVRVPATVIYGDADAAIEPRLFAGLEPWFPAGLECHEVRDCGHWPHLERPREVVPLIEAALRRER